MAALAALAAFAALAVFAVVRARALADVCHVPRIQTGAI
jgi:hypothetical protein